MGIRTDETSSLRSTGSIFETDISQRNAITVLSSSTQLWILVEAMQKVQVTNNLLYNIVIAMTVLKPLTELFTKYQFRQVLKNIENETK